MQDLLTTREVAEKYGVAESKIRRIWIPNGLKYLSGNPYMFKIEWVEEFIERQATEASLARQPSICSIANKHKFKSVPKFNANMKIELEDIMGDRYA